MAKKKKSMKKSMMMDSNMPCGCNQYFGKGYGLIKLASMALILFLITVWPAVGNWLVNVHWGWYLGIAVLFSILAMKKMCWCRK